MSEELPAPSPYGLANLITASRIALTPFFAWAFLSGRADGLAFGILAVMGISDFLDGFTARALHQVSSVGKVFDPVADRVAIIVVLLAFAFRGTIWLPLALAILARDIIVSVTFLVLESKGYPRIAVSMTGKVATFAIFAGLGLAVGALAAPSDMNLPIRTASTVFLGFGAVAYWVAGVFYVQEVKALRPTEKIA